MRDSDLWAGLAAAFSYPGTGPRDGSWEDRLPEELARRAQKVGRTRLQSEHTRLYASWYLEGQLMGDAASRLRRLYRGHGVDAHGEAPDHIAVQLAFVSALTESDHAAAGDETLDPESILSELRTWAPRFFDDVHRADRTGFYVAAAEACKGALGLSRAENA